MRCHDLSMLGSIGARRVGGASKASVTPALLVNNAGWEVKCLSRKRKEGEGERKDRLPGGVG